MMDQRDLNLEIQTKLDRICNGMEVMSDKQEEMSEDIAKIKEAELCSSLNSIICCLKGPCKRHLNICIKPQRSQTILEPKFTTAESWPTWVGFKDRAPVDPHLIHDCPLSISIEPYY